MGSTTTHVTDLAYAADLAKGAQITADYQALAHTLAGPLEKLVGRVFPGHLLLVYLLTDISRRQVWNAYLSSPRIFPHVGSYSDEEIAELRDKLLICRTYALIVDGYGSSERGLIGLYAKLGAEAHPPEFYVTFHQMLTANERLRKSLCHIPTLNPRTLNLIFAFPPELQSYAFARSVLELPHPLQFAELYDHIKGQCFLNKDALMERLNRLIQVGRGYRAALKDIRDALAFPPQVVPNEGQLHFISNGLELAKIADRYRNCLRGEVSGAFSGEFQYYERIGDIPAIICVKRHRGPTWYIVAIKLKDNEDPSKELDAEIRAHFRRHGIGERCCAADLFERFIDEIGDVTDELAECEAIRRG